MSFPSSSASSNCGELASSLAHRSVPLPKQPLSRKSPTFTFGMAVSAAFVDAENAASDIMVVIPVLFDCAILIFPKLPILVFDMETI